MRREEFQRLAAGRIIRLDGATGTELVKRGLPPGVCPEEWCVHNPDAIVSVQQAYCRAGSDLLYAPTFGANPLKLAEFVL
ncbi:MAG: homocysteine S-methyltransferase family protein, partial [Lentisphaeria bacterium]|nr:homocysteine S-methyltransferase family protein [Lentisphaeria bacterium]